jgi:hypothetical protein
MIVLKTTKRIFDDYDKITSHVYDGGFIYRIVTEVEHRTPSKYFEVVPAYRSKLTVEDSMKFIFENRDILSGESKGVIEQLERDIKLDKLLYD